MGVPTMGQARTFAGLDVHAAKVVAAVVDAGSGELRTRRLAGSTERVVEFCVALPAPVKVTFEAGPTGFGLARRLGAAGVECLVAAPGKIARPAQDRVKTDRRDAELLVRLLMAGQLHPVRVPTPEEEALRDLVRAREDLRGDLMRARHRVGKLLLRHERRFTETRNWTQAHREWLARVELDEPVAQAVLVDGIGAIDALVVRRDALERQMQALWPQSPWAREVARLRCLRGIDTLSALGLCAEIGDFRRFERPTQLMSFLGLVPSENSTGDKRRQGSITKSGSDHARRLLVEAAWHYRRSPRVGRELARRQDGQPQAVCALSWQAQRRLNRKWRRLDEERGKRRTLVAVAVARELAGFCWATATTD
jgi:transposase